MRLVHTKVVKYCKCQLKSLFIVTYYHNCCRLLWKSVLTAWIASSLSQVKVDLFFFGVVTVLLTIYCTIYLILKFPCSQRHILSLQKLRVSPSYVWVSLNDVLLKVNWTYITKRCHLKFFVSLKIHRKSLKVCWVTIFWGVAKGYIVTIIILLCKSIWSQLFC